MDWADVLRILNAIGCGVALWFLGSSAYRQWHDWSEKTQLHWWALLGWVFLGFEGSIENAWFHTVPGPRVIIQSLVIVFTLRALAHKGELRAQGIKPWKKED